MPLGVKLAAALHALGLELGGCEFHHEPPISQRPIDPETGDTIPPMNDYRHIIPMPKADHRARTVGDHRPLSGDISVAAKLKRNETAEAAFRARLLAKDEGQPKPKSKWASRPFRSKKKG